MGICEPIKGSRKVSNDGEKSNNEQKQKNFETPNNGNSNNNISDNTMDYDDPNKDFDDNPLNFYDKDIKDDSSVEKDETINTTLKIPELRRYLDKSIKASAVTNNSLMYSTNSNNQEEIYKKGDILNSDYFLTKLGENPNIFSSTRYENGEKPLSESYASQNNNNISGYNQIGYINKSMGSKSNYENRINTSIHESYAGISQSAYLNVPREDQTPMTDIGEISESML